MILVNNPSSYDGDAIVFFGLERSTISRAFLAALELKGLSALGLPSPPTRVFRQYIRLNVFRLLGGTPYSIPSMSAAWRGQGRWHFRRVLIDHDARCLPAHDLFGGCTSKVRQCEALLKTLMHCRFCDWRKVQIDDHSSHLAGTQAEGPYEAPDGSLISSLLSLFPLTLFLSLYKTGWQERCPQRGSVMGVRRESERHHWTGARGHYGHCNFHVAHPYKRALRCALMGHLGAVIVHYYCSRHSHPHLHIIPCLG
jgi:hypothetical protein